MAKVNYKSIVALMVIAIAILVSGCSKDDSVFGLDLENKDKPVDPDKTYELVSSRHIRIASCALVNDSIRITCDHVADFKGTNTPDVKKEYNVFNPSKLGDTKAFTDDINKVTNKSFLWENGKFTIDKGIITLALGKTTGTVIELNGKNYTIENGLKTCTVKKIELVVGEAVKTRAVVTEYSAPAKIVFTLSCDESCEYPLTLAITETKDDLLSYTYDDAIVVSKTQAKVVRHNIVNGVETGTKDFFVPISATLTAEGKKTVSDLTALNNPSVSLVSGGNWSSTFNVVSHSLTETHPATVSFVDTDRNETITANVLGNWKVEFVSKNPVDNSNTDRFIYTTSANYRLLCEAIEMATAVQAIEQSDDKNKQTITVTIVEEKDDQVKIRLFIDNSKEADKEFFFYAPSGVSISTEAAKNLQTAPVSLTKTGHNPASWSKGSTLSTADGKVKYTVYSRVDTYVYNDNKVSSKVTYTKNDDYVVVYESKEYAVSGLGTIAINDAAPLETADDSDNNKISKSYKVVHSILRGSVNKTADQLFTLWKNRTPNTIPGYYVKAAAMTDIYDGNRTAPVRTVICVDFQEIDGPGRLYVQFDTKGNEISRHANINRTGAGIMSMVWNGGQFVPGALTGVTDTNANPQEWLYTSYENASVQGYVSPMSVTKHSLKNPFKEEGKKVKVDGEDLILINGIYLK